jgi:hypothetical protein
VISSQQLSIFCCELENIQCQTIIGEQELSNFDVRMSAFGKIDNLSLMMPHCQNYCLLIVSLCTSTTKRMAKSGPTIHHTALDGWFCPAKCLVRRVAAICQAGMPNSTPLSYVSPGTHVVADHILKAVRDAVMQSGLILHAGYSLDRIGAHSLHATGAMALKLNGYSAEDIMKIGRWTSITFLTYIHSQIAALNQGIAANMSQRIAFHNVGG